MFTLTVWLIAFCGFLLLGGWVAGIVALIFSGRSIKAALLMCALLASVISVILTCARGGF